jgi:hypothetical protein
MNYIKTVQRLVAGSIKHFDIIECTVDAVDTETSNSGKKMVTIEVEAKTYKGLYNEWVYNFLCEHEGSPSFIVLWKAPKGDPMVAYVKAIWQNHLIGQDDAPPEAPVEDAFVYMWVNKDDDRKYIGKHCGSPDDGYIASSDSFLREYNESPSRFVRTILFTGTDDEVNQVETALLLSLKAGHSDKYYNLSYNMTGNRYGN